MSRCVDAVNICIHTIIAAFKTYVGHSGCPIGHASLSSHHVHSSWQQRAHAVLAQAYVRCNYAHDSVASIVLNALHSHLQDHPACSMQSSGCSVGIHVHPLGTTSLLTIIDFHQAHLRKPDVQAAAAHSAEWVTSGVRIPYKEYSRGHLLHYVILIVLVLRRNHYILLEHSWSILHWSEIASQFSDLLERS